MRQIASLIDVGEARYGFEGSGALISINIRIDQVYCAQLNNFSKAGELLEYQIKIFEGGKSEPILDCYDQAKPDVALEYDLVQEGIPTKMDIVLFSSEASLRSAHSSLFKTLGATQFIVLTGNTPDHKQMSRPPVLSKEDEIKVRREAEARLAKAIEAKKHAQIVAALVRKPNEAAAKKQQKPTTIRQTGVQSIQVKEKQSFKASSAAKEKAPIPIASISTVVRGTKEITVAYRELRNPHRKNITKAMRKDRLPEQSSKMRNVQNDEQPTTMMLAFKRALTGEDK